MKQSKESANGSVSGSAVNRADNVLRDTRRALSEVKLYRDLLERSLFALQTVQHAPSLRVGYRLPLREILTILLT